MNAPILHIYKGRERAVRLGVEQVCCKEQEGQVDQLCVL